ncbi:protein lifeguard 1 [Trichonephila clavipes]|nr:protein lifeguard 1 [Trichonephila clavipes]
MLKAKNNHRCKNLALSRDEFCGSKSDVTVYQRRVKLFVRKNIFVYYISYAIFLGVYIALACCGNLRRKYPTNMILLSIFTMSMSYMLGTISSFYNTDVVLMAVGICAAVCLAVSVFSFHTKFDFTSCGGILFILVWVLFLFGILTIFTYNRIMTTIYAGCGALLFVLFLAYDTQMLMGGKKHELSPEEHLNHQRAKCKSLQPDAAMIYVFYSYYFKLSLKMVDQINSAF